MVCLFCDPSCSALGDVIREAWSVHRRGSSPNWNRYLSAGENFTKTQQTSTGSSLRSHGIYGLLDRETLIIPLQCYLYRHDSTNSLMIYRDSPVPYIIIVNYSLQPFGFRSVSQKGDMLALDSFCRVPCLGLLSRPLPIRKVYINIFNKSNTEKSQLVTRSSKAKAW